MPVCFGMSGSLTFWALPSPSAYRNWTFVTIIGTIRHSEEPDQNLSKQCHKNIVYRSLQHGVIFAVIDFGGDIAQFGGIPTVFFVALRQLVRLAIQMTLNALITAYSHEHEQPYTN